MPFGFVTEEARVNSTTAGNQRMPASAALYGGGYVTVWASDTGDGSGSAILGQIFAADGSKVGDEFLVNTTTLGNQDLPDVVPVAPDSPFAASFVVVWQSEEGGGNVIRGRRFNENGTPTSKLQGDPAAGTNDFVISGAEGGSKPSVGATASGGFYGHRLAIVWEAPTGDGDGTAILMARYIPGQNLHSPQVLNTSTAGNQRDPRIANDRGNGTTAIVWESQEPGGDVIRASKFGPNGPTLDFVVSEAVGEDESLPNVTWLADRTFAVIWNAGTNIMARRFDGSPFGPPDLIGSATVLNSTPGGVTSRSGILGLADAGFVVAYFTQAGDDGSSNSIRAERFSILGTAIVSESSEFFIPNNVAGTQTSPEIIQLHHGNIVVSWASEAAQAGNFEVQQRLLNLNAPGGTPADDTINGTEGPDVLGGLAGNDIINGHGGNDLIDGGSGNDAMDGGDGTDTVTYATATAPVTISLANSDPQANGAAGTDTVTDFENVTGSPYADILIGTDGANVIDGGTGADSMTGGDGDDVYRVDNAGDVVVENAGEGTDEIRTGLASYSLLGTNLEMLTATSDLNHDFRGSAGNNVIAGGGGSDFFRLQDGGVDIVDGGTGNDAFYFGAAYTAADVVVGGAGRDQVGLQGNYALTLGTLTSISDLILLSGTDTRFGDPGASLYSYAIASIDSNVAAGQRLLVDGTQLVAGERFEFDGSDEQDGNFVMSGGDGLDIFTGGAGADGFYFRHGTFWGPNDKVTGGANDQIGFRGDFTGVNKVVMGADQITGVVTLVMMSGTDTRFGAVVAPTKFDIQMHDGNVAAGQRFTVDGSFLGSNETMRIDASLEQDGFFRMFGGSGADILIGGSGNDSLRGNGGGDQLTGNGGSDRFVYGSASDSTGTGFDLLFDLKSAEDLVDLHSAVTGWSATVGSGQLGHASFDADLAAALNGALDPGRAILFDPNSGTFAGLHFLVVDANGDGSYTAGADYVFQLGAAAVVDTGGAAFFV